MTRSKLISRLCKIYPYMNLKNVDRVLSIILEQIINKLSEGGRVELRDFGSFFVRERHEKLARNPRTGQKVTVKAHGVPWFKPGRGLMRLLNENESESLK